MEGLRTGNRNTAKQAKYAVAGLVLALLIAWVFVAQIRKQGFDWQVFWATLRALNWYWLGAATILSYATYAGRALRWAVLLKPLRPKPRFWPLLSATIIGFTATTIFGRAGELVRPYLIANREKLPFPTQIAAWIVERIYDVLVALAVFGFALSRVRASGVSLGPALSWTLEIGGIAVFLVSGVCLAVLLAMRFFSDRVHRWLLRTEGFLSDHHLDRVRSLITAFVDGVRATKTQGATAKLIVYTVLEWLLIAASYACILQAFGTAVHLGIIDVLIFMGFVSFGSLVQLPGVGGGAQVTAVLVLTEIFNVPIEVATSLALLTWGITFVSIVPVGVGLALHEGLNWARLRQAGLREAGLREAGLPEAGGNSLR